jgi:hypothetical protein
MSKRTRNTLIVEQRPITLPPPKPQTTLQHSADDDDYYYYYYYYECIMFASINVAAPSLNFHFAVQQAEL